MCDIKIEFKVTLLVLVCPFDFLLNIHEFPPDCKVTLICHSSFTIVYFLFVSEVKLINF